MPAARRRGWSVGFAALAAMAAAIGACASLKQAEPTDAAAAADGAAADGAALPDASQGDAPDAPHDAGPTDALADAKPDADATTGPTGLNPALVLPPLGAPACDSPGNPASCGGLSACRMATPDSGRCDDCGPPGTCGTLITQPCAASLDCDINLQCFRGTCTLFCTLPTGPECGMSNHCVDVGSVTSRGLCDPAFLF